MNSHTLSNEIQNLVHIGYNLNPSLVISHTGWNDSKYFKFNPKNFKKAGLIYYPAQIEWYDKLYDIKNKNNHRKITFEEADKEIFGNSIEKNIVKFEKIAKSFNSDLIIGIQPYDKTKAINKIDAIFLKVFEEKVEDMNIDKINFNKSSENFSFVDAGHTSQSGAYKIANIYFEHIKKNYSTKITEKILK